MCSRSWEAIVVPLIGHMGCPLLQSDKKKPLVASTQVVRRNRGRWGRFRGFEGRSGGGLSVKGETQEDVHIILSA